MAMVGVAVMLLISPFYIGAVFLGAAIGIAVRIAQRERRAAVAASAAAAGRGRRRRGSRR
jgi:hypothetical protein